MVVTSASLLALLLGGLLPDGDASAPHASDAPRSAASPARAAAVLAADSAGVWTMLPGLPTDLSLTETWARPAAGQGLALDYAALAQVLATAPPESATPVRLSPAVIALPRPDGQLEQFAFVESSNMAPELQQRYPEIRTYLAQGLSNPAATARFDVGPLGFHAMVLGSDAGGTARRSAWYIDPVTRTDPSQVASYWHGAIRGAGRWSCGTEEAADELDLARLESQFGQRGIDVIRNEFWVAIAATGEYTTWVSMPQQPSVALGLSAIVTALNRVNLILERDGPVRLKLVGQEDQVIYTNPATDPYNVDPNNGPIDDLLDQNQANLDSVLGADGYGLGHVFHVANLGGKAALASVCTDSRGRGATTSPAPAGDYFHVDYVAHEIGHQLGATHTFNGWYGNCGNPNQWSSSSAYEPGSGSTIMSYAGNCGADNIVFRDPNDPTAGAADPMYSFISMLQIAPVVVGAECVTQVHTGNTHPGETPDVQGPYYLPTATPFRLLAPDAEFYEPGEALTYSIEQADLGPRTALGPDTGIHEPLLRVRAPIESGERWFPPYDDVLNGVATLGENLPRYGRSSTFKGVIRDNVAGAGGWGIGEIQVEFVPVPPENFYTGFRVTAPVGGEAYCGGQVIGVTWDIAGTNEAPISAETVDILLSTDNGQNFPWALAADFPNAGAALVPLPFVPTTEARIMVRAATGSLFHSVNAGPFEVATGLPTIVTQPVGVAVCPGTPFTLSATAAGGSPRHFQWYRNGTPIPGADDSTHHVSAAQNFMTGEYQLVVSNGCGLAESNTVHVQVGVTFDSQPLDQTPAPCDAVILNVIAQGVGTLTYQWFGSAGALDDAGHISGAHAPSLTFDGVRYDDEGIYWCAVSDQCETRTTVPVTITLPTPSWVHVTSSGPSRRHQLKSDMAFDAARGVSVLYGGQKDSLYLGDTWEWDGVEWTPRFPTHNPGQRIEHELVFDNVRSAVLLFGGWSPPPVLSSREVWAYDGDDWTLVTDSPDGPPANYSLQGDAAFDPVRGTMIVVYADGSHPDPPTNNTWEFDSTTATWQLAYTGVGPSSAISPVAFDLSRGCAVGQYYSIPQYNAYTWTYAGTSWSTAPNAGTPERNWPAMAYDAVRRRATLFGSGRNTGQPSAWHSDTYAFNGAQWSQVLPEFHEELPGGPFPPTAMVFDTHRRAMVVIGNDYAEQFQDVPVQTWEYRYSDQVMFDRAAQDADVPAGGTVELQVVANGAGVLAYQWRHDDVALVDGPGPGGSVISGALTPTLRIELVAPHNAGTYTVDVTNACGTATSPPASLTVAGIAGDCNGDGVVGLSDFLNLTLCLAGPESAVAGDCVCFDLHFDGDVDLVDFALFQRRFGDD
jgi:hypothetical protein